MDPEVEAANAAGQGRNLPFKWSFESIDALAGYKRAD